MDHKYLIYDGPCGEHINDTVTVAFIGGYGGFLHNGVLIRHIPGDTPDTMYERWQKAINGGSSRPTITTG